MVKIIEEAEVLHKKPD